MRCCEKRENGFIVSAKNEDSLVVPPTQRARHALSIPQVQMVIPNWAVFSRVAGADLTATRAPSVVRGGSCAPLSGYVTSLKSKVVLHYEDLSSFDSCK